MLKDRGAEIASKNARYGLDFVLAIIEHLGISRKGSNEAIPAKCGRFAFGLFPSFYHLLLWLRVKHMSNLVSLNSSVWLDQVRGRKGREGKGGVRVVVEATEIICPTSVAVRHSNYRTVS